MSSSITTIAGLGIVLGAMLTATAVVSPAQAVTEQNPVTAAPQGAPVPAAPPPGGRGRGNATALLFTERCSGCHGTGLAGGRAPSLFDETWTRAKDDEGVRAIIHDGVPGTEMLSFAESLNDQQIWQLVAYIRTQAVALKDKPVFVADPDGQLIKSEKQAFKIEVVARDIETPWGLAFLPDGRLLVTERPGRLRIVQKGKLAGDTVTGTPKVWEKQDGGLLDVEVHPEYAKNGWIYLAYAETLPGYAAPPPPEAPPAAPNPPPPGTPPQAGGRGRGGPPDPPSMTVIVRGKINTNNEWTDQQVLFRGAPELYSSTNAHYGSRFIFDKQGHLFFSLGEKNDPAYAQNLSDPRGKIHRVNDDGSVPKDNPFVGKQGVLPTIWSYGHRNPQGLAWDPVTGKLWESEHGPQGGDEINIIEPGRNYGWGVITMGIQPGITERAHEGMEQPIVYFTPSIAPSGIVFYAGTQYPAWKNNLFVSALAGQQLRRLEISADKVTHQEQLFNQFGRVHDVITGPDGYLYITLQLPGQSLSQSTPGMVARLIPVKQ
jgi:glucose/arabinose dehydrogenase/cytochrome c5